MKNLKKRILYGALTFGLIWLFWSGIPIDFFASNTTLVAIVAAISLPVPFIAFCVSFMDLPESPEETDKTDNSGYAIVAGLIIFIFIFPIALIYHETQLESDEFENYGIYTTGTITDGSSLHGRRVDFSSVVVAFTSEEGYNYNIDHSLSAAEFNRLSKDQEVPLVYSKRHPNLLKILYTYDDILKYSKGRQIK